MNDVEVEYLCVLVSFKLCSEIVSIKSIFQLVHSVRP